MVTYNFDDLLERELLSRKVAHHSIDTENDSYDPDELPIYHVHGFLPEKPRTLEGSVDSTLVFSEEGYHTVYSNPYHWSNLVQLNCLRENTCIMIGLSMADPNLRRLLDIAARNLDKPKHFAFMRRLTKERFNDQNNNGANGAAIASDAVVEKFLENHHALNEEIMKELGVHIIWFEEFKEIPEKLQSIMGISYAKDGAPA